MAATNYTPIQLYFSTTASAVPLAANLAQGELAINITDGKLYYEDNAGVVQVIATKGAGTIGGSTTQIQYNNAGALAGNAAMTFNSGTSTTTLTTLNLTNALGATYGGTAQSSYTQGDILYSSATNTLSKLGIGTVNYILTSSGSVPQWAAPSSITVNTATNLAGGAAGSVPYQSGVATTTFLAIGAADRVMTSSGTAPQWVTSLTGLTGVSSSSITNTSLTSGRVVVSTTGGAQADDADLTFDGTTLSAGGYSTAGLTTLVKTVTIGNSNFNGTAVFAAATPAKLYIGTGTVTDTTSSIGATNAVGAVSSLAITPIAATNTSVTYTNAATLYIAGAPSAGTNVTLTNPYALYVAAGDAYFGGTVTAGTVNLTTLDLTNLEVTNIKAKDGTASITLADSTGVASFTANPILSGGTANGVVYLNGSKVATTGATLVFDGSNLGVGTAPSQKLTVSGAINLPTDATNPNSGVSLWSQAGVGATLSGLNVVFNTGANAAQSERVRITNAGNVGIGTSSPASILDVQGANPTITLTSATTSGSTNKLTFKTGFSGVYGDQNIAGINAELRLTGSTVGGANAFVTVYTDATERLRITQPGLVGIGTSAPRSTLNVVGDITLGATPGAGVAGTSYSIIGNSAVSSNANGGGLTVVAGGASGSGTNGNLTLRAGQTVSPLSISTGGNVIIESGKPSDNLASGYIAFNGYAGNPSAAVERMRITSAGNVGIGSLVTYEAKLKIATTNGASDFASSGINICGAAEITSGQVLPISFTPIGNDSTRARAAIGCIVGVNWGTGNLGFYTRSAADASVLSTADERMRLTGAGELLVGTTTSSVGKMVVAYTSVGSSPLGPANAGLNLWGDSSVRLLFGTYTASPFAAYIQASNTGSGFPIALNPAGGFVGIGTSSPNTILQINYSAPTLRLEETTTGGSKRLELGVTSGGLAFIGANQSSQDLTFQTVGSERMRIASGGTVLVNTTSTYTNTQLNVNGDINATRFHSYFYTETRTGSTTFYFYGNASSGAGNFNYASFGTGDILEVSISSTGASNEAGCIWTGWTDGDAPWLTMSSYTQGQLGSFSFATGTAAGPSGYLAITWNPNNAGNSCSFWISIRRVNRNSN